MKGNITECWLRVFLIAEKHVAEVNRGASSFFCLRETGGSVLPAVDNAKDIVNSSGGSHSAGEQNDQIGQLNQFHQNLRHIVYLCNYFSLGKSSGVNLPAADPEDGDNSEVNHHIGERIQKSGYFSDEDLSVI